MNPIYLDYAATTPVDPQVMQAMQLCLSSEGIFGNPASLHFYGLEAKKIIDSAREEVANLIGAESSEIIWTSGATESNNLAIKGASHLYQRKGKHLITMQTEHKAVLECFQYLEKKGFQVTYLEPEPSGKLNLTTLENALRDDTILVSIMHINNETGVIQDLLKIATLTSNRGILLHVDAAQTPAKTAINIKQIPIDLLSLSAHKVYGPKGIGALYLRKKPRVRVEPLFHGGGHEQGMRSGTLATHQIVGMGEAYRIARERMKKDNALIIKLRDQFIAGLKHIPNFKLNLNLNDCVPHILNVRFEGMIADAILARLPNIATSTASACQGKGTEGSYILRAMGFSNEQIKSSIRFSFGRFTTEAEIEEAINDIRQIFNLAVK